jgi:uncharacterized protein (TIGR02145 family)
MIVIALLIQSGCEKENQAPGCKITDPEIGEEIPHGTQVSISVDATDTDGDVYGVNFYINDASLGISNSIPFHYVWNTIDYEPGDHTIGATAKDDGGLTRSHEIIVKLTEGVPMAGFSVYQTSICPDSSAQFYNRSINNPASWLWDFGDGNSSVVENPSHTYSEVGIYTVSLTVTNSFGTDSDSKTDYIVVPEPVSDYDGNVYQTVQIGEQLWMKENLKSTHYADGTALINGRGAGDISGDYSTKYYFSYNDNEDYVDEYGRLYTWAATVNGASGSEPDLQNVQGVCPDGWHVPGDDEWRDLEVYLGITEREADQTYWRGTTEGLVLKEPGTSHWSNARGDLISGTNESGFSALAGGSRLYNKSFSKIGQRANFWSATESIGIYAWQRRLYYNYAQIHRYDDYKSRGYSVRCLKDEEE